MDMQRIVRGFLVPAALVPAVLATALLTAMPGPAVAQDVTPLTAGRVLSDSLGPDEVDAYSLELEADWFVLGAVDQQTVDVVVRVLGPDGERVLQVDGPAVGPEIFRFTSEAAGAYRVEVESFEDGAGRYAVSLRRMEPVATDPEGRVDQIMAIYDDETVPGGVVGVVRDGELVFVRAYGMADLTYGIPFDVETPNNIGSTSKQFTAFAVNLLAERGELSLDDDIRKHIPELPAFGDTVTLRHLMTHTSGYREFLNALAIQGRRLDMGDFVGRHEIIDLVQRQPELQNAPGGEFNYNNTGFALLAMVVERVTGESFPEWMDANVFEPLGMERTVVRSDVGEIVPGASTGYVPVSGGWREARDLSASMGAGGIYATVADLARWMDNFDEPSVGGLAIFERMTTRYVLTDGDTTGYGMGLFVDEYRGLRRVHHGGADVAHRSQLTYFPELDAGVIAESNNATFNAGAIANQVAEAFFEEHMEAEEDEDETQTAAAPFDPASYDPESFDPLTGRYAMAEMPQFILSFFREGDTLRTQATGQPELRIEPTSDSTFRLLAVEASVTFHRNPDGTADSVTLHQNGAHVAHRVETEAWEPTAEELETYTGRYFSPELETFYTIAVEDGALVIRHRRYDEALELSPGSDPHHFTGSMPVATAEFTRNDAGEVTGVTVGNGRTRGVRFECVEPEMK